MKKEDILTKVCFISWEQILLLYGKVDECVAPKGTGMALRKISNAYFSSVL